MLATKVVSSNNNQSFEIELPPKLTNKQASEQKDNSANEMIEAALQENWSKLGTNIGKKVCVNVTMNNQTSATSTTATSADPKNAKKRRLLRQDGNNSFKTKRPFTIVILIIFFLFLFLFVRSTTFV